MPGRSHVAWQVHLKMASSRLNFIAGEWDELRQSPSQVISKIAVALIALDSLEGLEACQALRLLPLCGSVDFGGLQTSSRCLLCQEEWHWSFCSRGLVVPCGSTLAAVCICRRAPGLFFLPCLPWLCCKKWSRRFPSAEKIMEQAVNRVYGPDGLATQRFQLTSLQAKSEEDSPRRCNCSGDAKDMRISRTLVSL